MFVQLITSLFAGIGINETVTPLVTDGYAIIRFQPTRNLFQVPIHRQLFFDQLPGVVVNPGLGFAASLLRQAPHLF